MRIERVLLLAIGFLFPFVSEAELAKFDCPLTDGAPKYERGGMRNIAVFHLIARPDSYEKKSVTVTGVLKIVSTKLFLYPSNESALHAVSSMAVALRKPECIDYEKWLALGKLSGSYVSVDGIYLSRGYESIEAGGGELTEIFQVSPYN